MEKRPVAVKATLAALLLLAGSIVLQIVAGAEYPVVPPGAVIPLVVGGLLAWRPRWWSAMLALAVGLLIGVGSITTPNTGDHLSSGDAVLIAATVLEIVALAGIVATGAASVLHFERPGRKRAARP
jgi:hypothetical protein